MTEVAGAGTLREQQRAFTRRKLMEAGQQEFAANGYLDTRVEDIARVAGASRATFYLHFKSKSDLMIALAEEWLPFAVGTYHDLDEMLEDRGPQLRQRLREWLAQWLDVWTSGSEANHAMLQATMLDSEVEQHYLRVSEALVDSLKRYHERVPDEERDAARDRVLILEMMTQRVFALASQATLPVPRERLLDILTEMWSDVLGSSWPGPKGPGQVG
jgi:AcrR family transcriptional regulator